ncbi:MAG: RNB domain-containing ribonuclease [Gemmatimonadota bacterium]|nr:RNB domain-containing ribonuclease [Gemmatimonadota bacterium]
MAESCSALQIPTTAVSLSLERRISNHGHDSQGHPPHHGVPGNFDLDAAARRVAAKYGFEADLSGDAKRQLDGLTAPAPVPSGVRDLRRLLWSSIDNSSSLDLDQAEAAEALPNDCIRLLVAIADVDALVPKGSPLDLHAHANSTSVYTGVEVFPMLPEKLSTGLTSLNQDEDRVALIIETVVDANGEVKQHDVYRGVIRNQAKLAYDDVGAWLDGAATPALVSGNAALQEQLRLQSEAAQRLKEQRLRHGALELDTIEATPVAKNGQVVDLEVARKSKARDLIEDFMIASNIAIAVFLESKGRSGIRRVVREPERWSRIVDLAKQYGTTLPAKPDSLALANFLSARRAADPVRFPDLSLSVVKLMGPGEYALDMPGRDPGAHFGLAVHDYSHATAPNRRYADLVTQRLAKAALAGAEAPYGNDELSAIAAHCTEREDAANKVERTMRKVAAALLLAHRIGDVFDGIVTGVSNHGTFARLFHPPAEGMVVHGQHGLDVGDKVKLRLVHTDPAQGYIDFDAVR